MEGSKVLGVRRFYEATKRLEAFEWERAYDRQLIDPSTGLVRSEISEPKACPLCRGGATDVLFVKDGFPHERCRRCGMIFVNPALREDVVLDLFYGDASPDPWLDVLMSLEQQRFDRPKFERGLQLIGQQVPRPGRLLDVGCSYGFFLSIAREHGWQVAGVEPHGRARDAGRTNGLEIIRGPLRRDTFPEASFDVVTLWEILDHVPDPRQLLEAVAHVLRPGGALVAAVRNANSLAARVMRERCVVFLGRAHYSLFTVENLALLLRDTQFQPYHSETYITELGPINNFLDWQDPYRGDTSEAILDLDDQQVLGRNLGYKILAAAVRTP